MTRFDPTERIGITEVERKFLEFNWIPRDIFQSDVGIDMIVETCKEGNPSGKFLGVQIKSGESYFKEKKSNHIIFRPDISHLNYWLDYSMPVLLILYSTDNHNCYWQVVNKDNIEKAGKGFKIKIPLINILNKESLNKIEELTNTPPLLNKFQKLLLDKPMIDMLKKREKIVVELKQWINKSSGKADIRVFHVIKDEDKEESLELEQNLLSEFSAIGIKNYQSLYHFYPWALLDIDEVFYENYTDYDDDNPPGYTNIFIEDCLQGHKIPIVPYDSNGEIDSYRFVMKLNDYGKTFLDFYDYIVGGKQLRLNFDRNL